VLGSTEPRLWTPPLRPLTPDTSYGFDVNGFARDVVRMPYDPWQEWLLIHAGELLPDGRPRFRIVIVIVARQNGKTHVPVVLTLYWQFIERVPLILGTSTKLDYARESWQKAVKLGRRCADLDPMRPAKWTRETNGEQVSWAIEVDGDGVPVRNGDEYRYKIAASNEEGGRSLTIDRLLCDELRQHHDYSAWDAAEPAVSPWDAQIWGLSNAGDDRSVVLNDLRDDALEFIQTGVGDYRLGLFEWSAPEDADPADIHALAQANPNLNRRLDGEALAAKGARVKRKGGEALTGFKTENMCIHVRLLNPALDPGKLDDCLELGDLEALRDRVAWCVDVSKDEAHATLAAAAVQPDGRVRSELVKAWAGPSCVADLEHDLPRLVATGRPRVLGWFPSGPAAAVATTLKDRKLPGWPPPGVSVDEIRSEVPAVCMGLATQVRSEQFVWSDDPLFKAQAERVEKLTRGDGWVFSRRGNGHCDAVYATAGAVHLARTLPPPVGRPRLVGVS
jgi:hypothetical protein